MEIPTALSDNWLVLLLFFLFGGSGALLSKKNAENLWLFGWLYRRYRDRRQIAVDRERREQSAMEESLRTEISSLRDRLVEQQRYCEQQFAEQENEIRDLRLNNIDLLRYVAVVRRWALGAVESSGGDPARVPDLPDFRTWQHEGDT